MECAATSACTGLSAAARPSPRAACCCTRDARWARCTPAAELGRGAWCTQTVVMYADRTLVCETKGM